MKKERKQRLQLLDDMCKSSGQKIISGMFDIYFLNTEENIFSQSLRTCLEEAFQNP